MSLAGTLRNIAPSRGRVPSRPRKARSCARRSPRTNSSSKSAAPESIRAISSRSGWSLPGRSRTTHQMVCASSTVKRAARPERGAGGSCRGDTSGASGTSVPGQHERQQD